MVFCLVKLFDFFGCGVFQIYVGYICFFVVSEVGGLFFWGVINIFCEFIMYLKVVQDFCGWRIWSLVCGKSSIIVVVDESIISWGLLLIFGELGYGDYKFKFFIVVQEVKILDGIFLEQVVMGYLYFLVIVRDESEIEKEKIKKLLEYNF